MHGYGAKLTNIFSSSFELEIFDAEKNIKYHQQWSEHMTNVTPPEINENPGSLPQSHSESYTQVTFTPDLKLFSTSLSPKDPTIADVTDILQLFYRRALDLSGVGLFGNSPKSSTHQPIQVTFNGNKIPVNSFAQYMELFSTESNTSNFLIEDQDETLSRSIQQAPKMLRLNDQWEIGVIPSPTGSFEHMSFVNSVWTSRGGTHVNHITLQCVKYIQEVLMTLGDSSQTSSPISPAKIKNHLMLFVNCLVENPSFDSQGKESLTTKLSQFSSQSEIATKFMKKIFGAKSELIQAIYESNSQRPSLMKPLKGKFGKSILVDGLEDAHGAGRLVCWLGSLLYSLMTDIGAGNYRSQCTLIVTEGESAKALAIAGLLSLSSCHAYPDHPTLLLSQDWKLSAENTTVSSRSKGKLLMLSIRAQVSLEITK
jgi:DNA topoisomerase II